MPFAATWMDLVVLSAVKPKTNIIRYRLYVESKNDKNEHIYKVEIDSQTWGKNFDDQRGSGGGINQEFGITTIVQ